jgi:hypothetical protein
MLRSWRNSGGWTIGSSQRMSAEWVQRIENNPPNRIERVNRWDWKNSGQLWMVILLCEHLWDDYFLPQKWNNDDDQIQMMIDIGFAKMTWQIQINEYIPEIVFSWHVKKKSERWECHFGDNVSQKSGLKTSEKLCHADQSCHGDFWDEKPHV